MSRRTWVTRALLSSRPGGRLEAEVEELLAGLDELVLELLVVELADFGCARHQTSTSGLDPRPGRAIDTSLHRQLLDRALQRRVGEGLVHAGQLEEDPAGADDRNPVLGVALAGSHAGLGRLLGDRLVGEDPDPDLATTLYVPGHGDSGGLDLAGGEPGGLERLDAEVAEVDRLATFGHSRTSARAVACGA